MFRLKLEKIQEANKPAWMFNEKCLKILFVEQVNLYELHETYCNPKNFSIRVKCKIGSRLTNGLVRAKFSFVLQLFFIIKVKKGGISPLIFV